MPRGAGCHGDSDKGSKWISIIHELLIRRTTLHVYSIYTVHTLTHIHTTFRYNTMQLQGNEPDVPLQTNSRSRRALQTKTNTLRQANSRFDAALSTIEFQHTNCSYSNRIPRRDKAVTHLYHFQHRRLDWMKARPSLCSPTQPSIFSLWEVRSWWQQADYSRHAFPRSVSHFLTHSEGSVFQAHHRVPFQLGVFGSTLRSTLSEADSSNPGGN